MAVKTKITEKLGALIHSRRVWAAAIAALVVFSKELGGPELEPDKVMKFVGLVGTWIIGDSLKKTE